MKLRILFTATAAALFALSGTAYAQKSTMSADNPNCSSMTGEDKMRCMKDSSSGMVRNQGSNDDASSGGERGSAGTSNQGPSGMSSDKGSSSMGSSSTDSSAMGSGATKGSGSEGSSGGMTGSTGTSNMSSPAPK